MLTAALIGVRAWTSITNNRNKYMAQQMETLYYQSMNNNRGLLALLADRTEEEEASD